MFTVHSANCFFDLSLTWGKYFSELCKTPCFDFSFLLSISREVLLMTSRLPWIHLFLSSLRTHLGIISRTMTSAKIRRLYLELPSQFSPYHWISVNIFNLSDKPNIYIAERKQNAYANYDSCKEHEEFVTGVFLYSKCNKTCYKLSSLRILWSFKVSSASTHVWCSGISLNKCVLCIMLWIKI